MWIGIGVDVEDDVEVDVMFVFVFDSNDGYCGLVVRFNQYTISQK